MITDRPTADLPTADLPAEPDGGELAESGLVAQVRMMFRALWASPMRNALLALSLAIFLVIAATAYGQIRLNRWNQPFYDALSHKNFGQFLRQLGIFVLIAGALLALNVAQRWLGEMIKLKLRQGLVRDLVQNWLVPGRAFRLANAGPIGVNPDQRMHEDARHLTELSADLGIGLLQDSILLVSFISILWGLSSGFVFHVAGRLIAIPGYMVWAAIIYSGSASLVSYWVGRNLVDQNAERYAREADLRFSLVRVNEHIDAIALASGEADEARRIAVDLRGVLVAMRRLLGGVTNLTWVTAGYGWFTLVAPILAAAPLYFAGDLSFGGLMMASGAFMQVQSSLRWFVDNFSTLADWRATLLRVASFRRAVIGTDELHDVENRIEFREGEPGRLVIENLQIATRSTCTKLEDARIEITAGERVLIAGESGSGKTLLFRALAGLWPWGTGCVIRPRAEAIVYVPRISYLPPGTLREVLAYPAAVDSFAPDAFVPALERLALDRLVPLIDQARPWERVLSDAEQQALAFARILLHAPPWVVIDEALEALEDDTLRRVGEILRKELARTGVIYVGRASARDDLFDRVVHLTNRADGPRLAARRTGAVRPVAAAL
jgi:putative ATP-binding cassette transporter